MANNQYILSYDLTGKRFGRLTAIKEIRMNKDNRKGYICQCDCGTKKNILRCHIVAGAIVSCGCYGKEARIKASYKHGMAVSLKEDRPRLYEIWTGMKSRCRNLNNKNYGGRGIKLCNEWCNDFKVFYDWAMANGYSDDFSIDRIDVDGNYEPDNCRWISQKEQTSNTRRNIKIKINGETKSVDEWSNITGIKYATLLHRYHSGESGLYLIRPVTTKIINKLSSVAAYIDEKE